MVSVSAAVTACRSVSFSRVAVLSGKEKAPAALVARVSMGLVRMGGAGPAMVRWMA